MFETEKEVERVILVAVDDGTNEFDAESCLDELEDLANTADAVVVGRMIQKLGAINRATYLGSGKIDELKAFAEMKDATGIICDDELSPVQIRNLENALNLKVMSRTLVILDIFAKRAMSAEGKVQVELAHLDITFHTCLTRRKSHGIGTRGPGEKKLEVDRRRIADRISDLNKNLKEIERHRSLLRENRNNQTPVIALVGYTNAGKSTLLNALTGAGVLAEDKLFATLDTTTRAVETQSGANYLFTDTVGFIQKLPHGLIKAFRATLEEAKYADLLVHVVDASNPKRREQMNTVYKTLAELGADKKPIVTVYNKIDKDDIEMPLTKDNRAMETLAISAGTGIGLPEMIAKVEDIIKSFKKSIKVLIPYDKGQLLSIVHGKCEITASENKDEGYYFALYADNETENRLREYIINDRTI
ncbi:MAG: GTPase HflX [Muribaculaceae bacterium]